MYHLIDIPRSQSHIDCLRDLVNAILEHLLKPCAQRTEGEIEHQGHDGNERQVSGVASCEDSVNHQASHVLLADMRLDNRLAAQGMDKRETHVGNGCTAIQASLLLHLTKDMFDRLALVLRQLQSLDDKLVAFDYLCSGKAQRYACLVGMVFDKMHDGMQATVHCSTMVFRVAEILNGRCLLIFGDMDGMFDQFVNTLILHGADSHYRHSKHLLHAVDADSASVAFYLIHHIECYHHRHTKLYQLHRQEEVALDVGGIDDVDDALRTGIDDEVATHDLLA